MKRVPLIMLLVTASVLACGPFISDLLPVETVRPGDLNGYAYRGQLGVVRPHFARRYLVQAYRRMTGQEPLRAVGRLKPFYDEAERDAHQQWTALHVRVAGQTPGIGIDRNIGDYQFIVNCLGSAYAAAARTLNERMGRYGTASAEVRDWLKAQDRVFENCTSEHLVLPDPPPAGADPFIRGDRSYQIAAAYFYAMQYEEAVRRFRQIAADQTSPWRPYGHYLAARALLRQATTAKDLDRAKLAESETEFRGVLQDPAASFLHASARGLLDRIALRANPTERLRILSAALSTRDVGDQELRDYESLMDTALGDTTVLDYEAIADRAALAATSDMNDWILVMQALGPAASARALAKWKQTNTLPWLAAALWKVPVGSADVAPLVQAGARIDESSPAYYTIAFLRVRLLALSDRNDEARAVLAGLPASAGLDGRAPDEETFNLISALRFKLARSLDELLAAAPRVVVGNREGAWNDTVYGAAPKGPRDPVFDDDAGQLFSTRLPLDRLVAATKSSALPGRLRLRVAAAAFTRAWLLNRFDQALAVAPVLRQLSPSLTADMRRFETAATPPDRHIAGLRLVLRTPGLRGSIKGIEDDEDHSHPELAREFDHTFRRNWWCGSDDERGRTLADTDSQVMQFLYPGNAVPYPAFLSQAEIAAVETERADIGSLGPAPNYLAGEAIKWAKARPSDVEAAEALAHAVEGTRWGCTNDETTRLSRAAFQTLHQIFPKTEWARKTKYWY
jgi:hypothetical protein